MAEWTMSAEKRVALKLRMAGQMMLAAKRSWTMKMAAVEVSLTRKLAVVVEASLTRKLAVVVEASLTMMLAAAAVV
jgi:hypothetical protein